MTTDPNKENQTVFKEDTDEIEAVEKVEVKKTQSGLDENLAGALCYLVGFITGIIFLVIEKENRFIRFHAIQSIALSVVMFALSILLSFIPLIGWMFSLLLAPVGFILWLFMMWKAYQKETFKLPYIGNFAEEQLDKS